MRRANDLLLVTDHARPAIVAEHLGIPLVLVSNALILNQRRFRPSHRGLLDQPDAGPQPLAYAAPDRRRNHISTP